LRREQQGFPSHLSRGRDAGSINTHTDCRLRGSDQLSLPPTVPKPFSNSRSEIVGRYGQISWLRFARSSSPVTNTSLAADSIRRRKSSRLSCAGTTWCTAATYAMYHPYCPSSPSLRSPKRAPLTIPANASPLPGPPRSKAWSRQAVPTLRRVARAAGRRAPASGGGWSAASRTATRPGVRLRGDRLAAGWIAG
jgi:hypothetical protein